jgi:hypothetical protein
MTFPPRAPGGPPTRNNAHRGDSLGHLTAGATRSLATSPAIGSPISARDRGCDSGSDEVPQWWPEETRLEL